MKKSFKALALTLFVILSVAMIAVGTSAASIPGDVNGDGEVNIRDAAHILLFITDHDVELACTHSGYVVINPAVDPTYDQPGLTIGVSCTKCGEKLIPQDTIPALGHEHTEAVIPAVAANCQQEGLTEGKYCTTCNMVLVEQQTTPKTACNYVSTIVSPTCEEQGYTVHTCSVCGKNYTDSVTKALGHVFGEWEASGSHTVRKCTNPCNCKEIIRVTSVTAVYNGIRLLTGESVWKDDVKVTVTISDGTYFETEDFTLENDVMTKDGNNIVTVKFVNKTTTVTVPAIWDNLPGTNPASDFEYSGADKDAITITKYIGTSSEVVIPAHIDRIPVRYIGNSAFINCKMIRSVTIPGSILTIGQSAFYGCSGLKDLILCDGITTIQGQAFMGCPINKLVIPDSVNTIEVYIHGTWSEYSEGAFEACKNLTEVIIGNGLTSIPKDTFADCSALKSVVIGDGVSTINSYAFSGCSALTSVSMGNTIHTIGEYAFTNCTSLKKITLGSAVQSIAQYAFSGCTSLQDVVFSESVTQIGNYAFNNCTSLESIDIPGNVKTIGLGAFYGCSGLKNLTLCEGITTIKGQAFMGCPITKVVIPDSVNTIEVYIHGTWSEYSEGAFEACKNLTEVIIGRGLTSIPKDTFADCSALKSVVIGDGVSTIDSYAFSGCSALTSVSMGKTLRTIGSYAFTNCSSLETLEFGIAVQTISSYAFSGCTKLKNISFSETVTIIDSYAFQNCSSLESVEIPGNVKTIGLGAFYGCSGLKNLTLCDGITTIKGQAFMGCPITKVVIPDSVNTIEVYIHGTWSEYSEGAFEACKNLTEVIIGNGLTTISKDTFADCTALRSVVIGNSVNTISSYAFSGCSALTSVSMGNGLQTIESYAFTNCSSLENLEFGISVQKIGSYAFSGCSKLKNIDFSETVTIIDSYAFQNCSSLESVEIPGNVKTIGLGAFYGCSGLKNLTLCEGITTIMGQAFMGCPITKVVIPDSVNTIEVYIHGTWSEYSEGAFEGCKNLTEVIIGNGLTSIAKETFTDCSSLKSVVIGNGVTTIGTYAFNNCSALETIEFGTAVHTISDYAFSNCTALQTVNIPDNVINIGPNAFKGCTLLENFSLGTGVQSIGASALQDCTSLNTITIPANVQVIGDSVFTGCTELEETVIEKGALRSFGSNVYSGCSSFDRIYYSGSNTDWERISINGTNPYPLNETPYYYSPVSPSVNGNFWYYNSNGDIRVWEVSGTSFKAEEYSEDFAYAEFGSESTSYSTQLLAKLEKDSFLQFTIDAWETVNNITDFDSKKITKKEVYKLVIYDLLMGEVGSNVNPLEFMEEALGSYMIEYAKFVLDTEFADMEALKAIDPGLFDNAKFLKEFFDGVEAAEKVFSTANNLYDALYICAQYQALSDMDKNFCLVLNEISRNTALPSDLRTAASECSSCYQNASAAMLAKVFAKEFAGSTMEDIWVEFAEVAWETVITSIFPQYKVIEMTLKGVKFLLGAGFNLDARNEAYYQLEAAVGLENALRTVIKNTLPDYFRYELNGQSEYYMYAIDMYETSVLLGFDYSSILLTELSKGLDVSSSEKQAYESTVSQLGEMKTSKKQIYNSFNQAVEQLFTEYYA